MKLRSVEIAFYGGSFTGLAPDYQNRLLSWANVYIRKGLVESIRIFREEFGFDKVPIKLIFRKKR